jgi:hypothetical protein
MGIRLLVVSYFTLYQFGPGLAQLSGIVLFHGLLILPAATYVLLRTINALRTGLPVSGTLSLAFPLAYVLLYSTLYFSRSESGAIAIGNAATLIIHALFWHTVYSASVYRERRRRFFQDVWSSVAVAFVAGFLYAQSYIGFHLIPGSIHNLAERAPLVRSDLDIPFFALLLGIVGAVHLWRRKRLAPTIRSVTWIRYPSVAAGIALLAVCLFGLLMYNRRTPLFALIIIIAVLALPTRWGLRSVYAFVAFPLLPMFWNAVVPIVVFLTQNPVAAALLKRNTLESYLTATNRLAVWLKSIGYIADLRIQHLWGYGGAPPAVLESRTQWSHVHNAFMQMVFDAGFITLALAVILIVRMYRQLTVLVQVGSYRGDALALFGALVCWLVLSGVEPALRSVSAIHLFFIVLVSCVGNLYRETTPSPLGRRQIVLYVPRAPRKVLTAEGVRDEGILQ